MPKKIDMTIDADPKRSLAHGAPIYTNCLAFALNRKRTRATPAPSIAYTDACTEYKCPFIGIGDLATIMPLVIEKAKLGDLTISLVGTDPTIPTQNSPSISRRELIGVGQQYEGSERDLHFYVVTRSNGDGHGIAGTLDARLNYVMPCKLRNGFLRQYAVHGSPQHIYKLIGFIEVKL